MSLLFRRSRLLRALPCAAIYGLCVVGALSFKTASAAGPQPVGDSLDRPAIQTSHAAQSVLLAAARTGSRLVAVGERGIVMTSDDSGATWGQSPSPVSVTLTSTGFADNAHGYATGHAGTVLTTDDAGRTWTRRLDGRRLADIELQAARASGDATALKSAERLVVDGADKPLLDVLVMDGKRALAIGACGIAMATEDGGATWTSWRARLDNPKELHLYAARQRGTRIVIAGEQGLLMQSLDGGTTFKRVATPYSGSFFTAELPSDDTIVLAGLRGNAWRSTDAGSHWTQIASPMQASITGSALLSDGTLVFVDQAGTVMGLRPSDAALKPLSTGMLPPLNAVLPIDAGHLLALSTQGAQRIDLGALSAAPKGPSQ